MVTLWPQRLLCKSTGCEADSHLLDTLMWALPGRETTGYTWEHTNERRKKNFLSHCPPPICCWEVEACWHNQDAHLSSPPHLPHKPSPPHLSPSVHLEPVCASLGHPCPAQTNKPSGSKGGVERSGMLRRERDKRQRLVWGRFFITYRAWWRMKCVAVCLATQKCCFAASAC